MYFDGNSNEIFYGNLDENFDGNFDGNFIWNFNWNFVGMMGIFYANFDGNLMGILMMDSKGWPYDSFDCLWFNKQCKRFILFLYSLVHHSLKVCFHPHFLPQS